MIKLILKCDVSNLGNKNQIVEVSEGFARNFLLKQKKAVPATPSAIKKIEVDKAEEEKALMEASEKNKKTVQDMAKLTLEIKAKQKEGKMFGSVTVKEIQEKLAEKGIVVDKKTIKLPKPIKELGEYKIDVRLDKNNQGKLNLNII